DDAQTGFETCSGFNEHQRMTLGIDYGETMSLLLELDALGLEVFFELVHIIDAIGNRSEQKGGMARVRYQDDALPAGQSKDRRTLRGSPLAANTGGIETR